MPFCFSFSVKQWQKANEKGFQNWGWGNVVETAPCSSRYREEAEVLMYGPVYLDKHYANGAVQETAFNCSENWEALEQMRVLSPGSHSDGKPHLWLSQSNERGMGSWL